MGERLAGSQKVTGSSPVTSTKISPLISALPAGHGRPNVTHWRKSPPKVLPALPALVHLIRHDPFPTLRRRPVHELD